MQIFLQKQYRCSTTSHNHHMSIGPLPPSQLLSSSLGSRHFCALAVYCGFCQFWWSCWECLHFIIWTNFNLLFSALSLLVPRNFFFFCCGGLAFAGIFLLFIFSIDNAEFINWFGAIIIFGAYAFFYRFVPELFPFPWYTFWAKPLVRFLVLLFSFE